LNREDYEVNKIKMDKSHNFDNQVQYLPGVLFLLSILVGILWFLFNKSAFIAVVFLVTLSSAIFTYPILLLIHLRKLGYINSKFGKLSGFFAFVFIIITGFSILLCGVILIKLLLPISI